MPTSCESGHDEIIKDAVTSGRHQDRRRDLHRQLEARQRPDRDGAVPDGQQQQGRRGPLRERRHGRRRRRRARRPRASPARCRCRVRTAIRPPSTASRSAPRRSTSGRTPACSARPPARQPSQLCTNKDVTKVTGAAPFTTPGGNDVTLDPAEAAADHQGQPQDRSRCRLDHQGQAVPGRDRRFRHRAADPQQPPSQVVVRPVPHPRGDGARFLSRACDRGDR